jgi:hypothetical protein
MDPNTELWKYVFRLEMDRLCQKDMASTSHKNTHLPATVFSANAVAAATLAKEAVRDFKTKAGAS